MNFTEIVSSLVEDFFSIFTFSVLGYIIFMYIYGPEQTSHSDLIVIFILSGVLTFAGLIIPPGKELKRLNLLVRYIIHFFVTLSIYLFVATYMRWIVWSIPISAVRMIILFIGITVSVHTSLFFQTKILSDKLNDKLKERYK